MEASVGESIATLIVFHGMEPVIAPHIMSAKNTSVPQEENDADAIKRLRNSASRGFCVSSFCCGTVSFYVCCGRIRCNDCKFTIPLIGCRAHTHELVTG